MGLNDSSTRRSSGAPSDEAAGEPVAARRERPPPLEPPLLEPPLLDDMNVGADDPQAPSHPAVGAEPAVASRVGGRGAEAGAGSEATDDTGRADAGRAETGRADEGGTAHRAPGLQGTTGVDEQMETDVGAGAAAMHSGRDPGAGVGDDASETVGDSAGVPATSDTAASGSSERMPIAQGTRTPPVQRPAESDVT